jgi:colicin import membrane protein
VTLPFDEIEKLGDQAHSKQATAPVTTNPQSAELAAAQSSVKSPASRQPLSQAELTAMRSRLASLWNVQPGVEHPEELKVTVRVRLNRDGRLNEAPKVVSIGNSPRYQAAANAAVEAILKGQPYTMLRNETYDEWKYMDIDFDPSQMFVR